MAASKKSANGQGSIIKRANGTWEWRLTLHYVDGTTERKSVYGKTQAEVKKKGDQLLVQAQGIKRATGLTVSDLVQMFYADAEKRLTHNTLRQYRYAFDTYLVPQFGSVKIASFKASTLDTLIDQCRKQGVGTEVQKEKGETPAPLGPNTLAIIRRCTRALFNKAVEWELLSKNPVLKSQVVKVERKLVQGFTPEQSAEYLKAFMSSPAAYPLAFALGTGLRIAECLGVKHSDIEERSGQYFLNVRQQLLSESGKAVLRPLKTQNSKRIIPLTTLIMEVVNRQKIIQARLGAKGDLELLFTNTTGSPVDVNNLRRWIRRELPKLGLKPITPHDLRRGFVSVLVAANADIKTVSALLGHADISTTLNIYAQANTKRKEEVMGQMEQLILAGLKSDSANSDNTTSPNNTGC
jgi:integrase